MIARVVRLIAGSRSPEGITDGVLKTRRLCTTAVGCWLFCRLPCETAAKSKVLSRAGDVTYWLLESGIELYEHEVPV